MSRHFGSISTPIERERIAEREGGLYLSAICCVDFERKFELELGLEFES